MELNQEIITPTNPCNILESILSGGQLNAYLKPNTVANIYLYTVNNESVNDNVNRPLTETDPVHTPTSSAIITLHQQPSQELNSIPKTKKTKPKKNHDDKVDKTVDALTMISEGDFRSICRICLNKSVHMYAFTYVDARLPKRINLPEMIKNCAPVQVEVADGLPQQVCGKCLSHMRKSLTIQQTIVKADATLRQILMSKVQPPIEAVYFEVEEANSTRGLHDTESVSRCSGDIPYQFDGVATDMPFMDQNEFKLDPSYTVGGACMIYDEEHSYYINDQLETCNQERQTYYCKQCSRTFVTNRLYHLHISKEHPKECSKTYLNNLLPSEEKSKDLLPVSTEVVVENPEIVLSQTAKKQEKVEEQPVMDSLKAEAVESNNKISSSSATQSQNNCEKTDNYGFLDIWKQIQKEAALKLKIRRRECRKWIRKEAPKADDSTPMKTNPVKKKLKTCHICDKTLTSSLEAHMRIHTSERPNMCDICGQTFIQRSALNRHRLTHSNVKNMICEICAKRFLTRKNLKAHLRTHMSPKIKCDQCPKLFLTPKRLDAHIRGIHKGELFKCPFDECKDFPGYTLKRNLNAHIQFAHAEADTVEPNLPYQCTLCPRSFSRQGHLDIHTKAHFRQINKNDNQPPKRPYYRRRRWGVKPAENEPVKCPECGKDFKTPDRLKVHLKYHGTARPYVCNCCNRNFSSEEKLKAHVRFNQKPKRHECPTCHKRFVDKAALRMHSRIHTGERPYECELCHRKFGVKRVLEIHMRLHNGVLPFECQLCDKKFPIIGNLNTHMLLKHNN